MKNKSRLASIALVIIISIACMLVLTSCTCKIDNETFYEKTKEAVDDYNGREEIRYGTTIIDGVRYEFVTTRNSENKWTVTYDESIPEDQLISLKILTSSLITTRADKWATTTDDDSTKYGMFVEIEGFKLVINGFEFRQGDLYLKFDKYGFLTEYQNGANASMLVEWH